MEDNTNCYNCDAFVSPGSAYCDDCEDELRANREFDRKVELDRMLKLAADVPGFVVVESGDGDPDFPGGIGCPDCDSLWATADSLEAHIERIHPIQEQINRMNVKVIRTLLAGKLPKAQRAHYENLLATTYAGVR